MTPGHRAVVSLGCLVVLAGCTEDGPGSPEKKERRTDLAQGILEWAQASRGAPPDVRADVALAVAEVASIDHAHRLRLMAADDANPFAAAAGHALARLRAARDADPLASLEQCGRGETLTTVQLGCLVELRARAPARYVAIVGPWLGTPASSALACASVTAGSPPPGAWRNTLLAALEALPEPLKSGPERARARETLLAPAPLVAPESPDAAIAALGQSDAESLRSALRALLLVPGTFQEDKRVETALLLASRHEDVRVQHLVEAVFLRRTLAEARAAAPR